MICLRGGLRAASKQNCRNTGMKEDVNMEQEKIGGFIASLRKEQGLTQKSLAEKINVTDKAVSKWENGRCLPDNSVMQPLCDVLGITVNELLSGERLDSDDYSKKAEENIMTLITENNRGKTRGKRDFLLSLIAVVVLVAYLVLSLAFCTDLRVAYFIDFFSFNAVVVIMLLLIVLAGRIRSFLDIFVCSFKKCDDADRIAAAVETADFSIKAVLLAGGIFSVVGFVNLMLALDTLETIGPNLAIVVLSWFYAIVISMVLLVLRERLKK
jgi:transcriptional regulator with XRE-family HTH domain